jgi:hypothetical protein
VSLPAAVYRPRNPQYSDYYRCVEDHFESFVGIYDEHFSRQYGFWRPYVEQVIYRYLEKDPSPSFRIQHPEYDVGIFIKFYP